MQRNIRKGSELEKQRIDPNYNSLPVTEKEIEFTRKRFDNRYSNYKYLAYPEKTYTQHILNVIFEDKQKNMKPQKPKSPLTREPPKNSQNPQSYNTAPIRQTPNTKK